MDEISSYSKRVDQIAKELQTDLRRGLAEDDALARVKKHGPNRLAEKDRISVVKLFLKQYKDFMILILACAAVISYAVGDKKDAIAIFAVIVVNGLISFFQEFQAERTLAALKKISGPVARVLRDGSQKKIPAARLTPGDVVVLEQGDVVPADCRLFEIVNLEIQESILTGESAPAEKGAQVILSKKVPLGEQRNMAFMGTVVTQGHGKAVVTAVGMGTEVGRIAHMIAEVTDRPTPLQIKLRRLGKRLIVATLFLCAAVFVTGVLKGYPLQQMVMVAISLGVAVVPEGLPAVVTIALAIGVQKMARRHAVVRRLPAVEALGAVTVIGSDKTGTLTEGRMRVKKVWCDGSEIALDGASEGIASAVAQSGNDGCPAMDDLVLVGMLCNNAVLRPENQEVLGDSTEGALLLMGRDMGIKQEDLLARYTFLTELPFDSRRKAMSKIFETPDDRIVVLTKGAGDVLMQQSTHVRSAAGDIALDDAKRREIADAMARLGGEGYRVLGFASRTLPELGLDVEPEDIETGLTFLGLVGIEDPPRAEIAEAVRRCHEAGIRTVMITGDHLKTALAIGQKVGMARKTSEAVTGEDMDRMKDPTLLRRILDYRVFARVAPEHKLRIVKFLRERGEVVAMTGDGVNDAPALKAANVGIAMGRTGTDVAKETADIVLTDDNFSTIVAAVEEGRTIYDNIRKFIAYLLSCNIAEIFLMFFALAMGLPVPLSPIQILWLNLVTDTPPALALGADPAQPDIMKRKPRDPNESLFSGGLFYRIAMQGLLMAILTIMLFVAELYWKDVGLEKARTMVFAGLAVLQLVHAFNCQSERFSVFQMASYFNRHLVLAFAFSMGLLMVSLYAPACQRWFHHVPLNWVDWMGVAAAAGILVLFVETVKRGFAARQEAH